MMTEEEQALYDQIMLGGYQNIKTNKVMIMGDVEILKNVLLLPRPVKKKTREEHLAELDDMWPPEEKK